MKPTLATLPQGETSQTFNAAGNGSAEEPVAHAMQMQPPKRTDHDLWVAQQRQQYDM